MSNSNLQVLRRIIGWSAWYDLVLTVPFATPWTARWMIALLASTHTKFGLPGTQLPDFEPLHLFFVNLFGTIVTLWAMLRVNDPQPHYGLADAAGRAVFSIWMVTYLWGYGGSGLLGVYLVPELIWAVVQWRAWWRWRASRPTIPPPHPADGIHTPRTWATDRARH